MKKTPLILLVASSLTALASCGGANGTLLPSGGTSIEQASGAQHLSTAIAATGTGDALGLRLNSLNLSAAADITVVSGESSIAATGKSSSGPTFTGERYQGSLDISGLKGSVMASGLTSSQLSEVKASASLEGSVKATYLSSSFDYSNMAVKAYVANGSVYADLSNAKFVEFINLISNISSGAIKVFPTSTGLSFSSAESLANPLTAGKYLFSNVLGDMPLPLLSEDAQAQLATVGQNVGAALSQASEYFKAYSYANGNYALEFNLTKETLIAAIEEAATNSSAASETGDMLATYADALGKFLTINACQAVVVYNDQGLVSSGANIDIAFKATFGDIFAAMTSGNSEAAAFSLPDSIKSANEEVSFKFAFSLDLLTGNDVVVAAPDDVSTYSVVPLQ